MLRIVPMGKSRFGCGTVTRPGRSGCLNCQWLPFVETCTHPAFSIARMTARLFMCINIHIRAECVKGVYSGPEGSISRGG